MGSKNIVSITANNELIHLQSKDDLFLVSSWDIGY